MRRLLILIVAIAFSNRTFAQDVPKSVEAGSVSPPTAIESPTGLPAPDPFGIKVRWKNGLYFYTEDGLFTFQPGGRFQIDSAFYALPSSLRRAIPGPTPFEDGIDIRRARFAADGTFLKTIDYKAEFDLANAFITQSNPQRESTVVVPTELNLTFRELPGVGNFRIGNQKQPISFEHITSSKFLNFLERSMPFDAFAEGFNNGFTLGAMLFNNFLADKRGYWAMGVFKNTRSVFGYNVGRGEYDLTGRLVGLPVYENGGETLLHLGVAGSYRDLDQDQQRFRARFGVRNSPSALADLISDTGFIFGHRESRIVPELVGVSGPFSFQSEYYVSWLSQAELPCNSQLIPVGTTFFHGGYVELHYFLTGEHRAYDHERMAFTRVTPKNPAAVDRLATRLGCVANRVTIWLSRPEQSRRHGWGIARVCGGSELVSQSQRQNPGELCVDASTSPRPRRQRVHQRLRNSYGVGLLVLPCSTSRKRKRRMDTANSVAHASGSHQPGRVDRFEFPTQSAAPARRRWSMPVRESS